MSTSFWRPYFSHVPFGCMYALGLALLAGCTDKTEPAPATTAASHAPATPPAAGAVPAAPAVGQTAADTGSVSAQASSSSASAGAKIQAYIACYNGANSRALDSIARYASWVRDMKAGPSGTEKIVYGLYGLHESAVKNCQTQVAQALQQSPALKELDAAAQSYVSALVALNERVAEAVTYYDRQDYKDDGFGRGKQMHGPLAASMVQFRDASQAFSTALEAANDQLLSAELQRLEQSEGRKLRYWQMSTMLAAKQLVNLCEQESFDIPKASAALGTLQKTADELLTYAKLHEDEQPRMWAAYPQKVEAFLLAAKERVRRVRDKTPYNDGERAILQNAGGSGGWMVAGSPDQLVHAYNELVSASNRLND